MESLKDKDKIVEIEFTQEGKMIAKHDSVTRETYDYLYNQGFNDATKKFKEAVKRLFVGICEKPNILSKDVDYLKDLIDEIFGDELSGANLNI